MGPLDTAEIGTTGLRVTRVGLGGAALAGIFGHVSEDVASRTILRAHELGVRYFDTAPQYGTGKSERRYARALAQIPRDEFVLSTKLGRLLEPVGEAPDSGPYVNAAPVEPVFDFSRDGVLRSLEDSLDRLRLDRVDIAFIHDPDDHYEQAISEAYPTLAELRSQGVVKAIGAGMNQWEMLARFAREGDFDCFLLGGRYTLLDQTGLGELLPLCVEKRISIVIGGPYNSGVLASDLSPGVTFDYVAAPPHILEKARRIKAVCDRHAVPLKAAALQFGLAHPAVAATIPGARSPSEVEENLKMAALPIPASLWAALKEDGLVPGAAPTQAG